MVFTKCKKKQKNNPKKFLLSEKAILFIKKYVLTELNISTQINEDMLDRIIDLATTWEQDMIDPLSEDGGDKTFDYPEKGRNEMADKFVGEITGQWQDEELVPDFDDLNKRLGLI